MAVEPQSQRNDLAKSAHFHTTKTTKSSSNVSHISDTVMSQTVQRLKTSCAQELGSKMAESILSSFNRLMEWISSERLRRLPTEGSAWDKTLAWAQSFAEKFHEFDLEIERFTGGNYDGAEIAFGYCILLLELGEDNAGALQTSFGFFFQRAIDLIALLDRAELFAVSSDITHELILAYADLVTLVSSIALRFYQSVRANPDGGDAIDIYAEFETIIQSFQVRRTRIVESMWSYQLSQESVDTVSIATIGTLRAWLDVDDYVLRYKTGDYTSLVTDRYALTCLWMTPYLTRFLNSQRDSLIITGGLGCGKSVLAGTIVDTLQKTATRRGYSVMFIAIDARIKPYSTGLYVAHKLLFQFLEQRVGNVGVYKVIADAYRASQSLRDIATYEALLWTTIDKVIELTIPNAKDTIIVIDGVDEVSEDPKGGQALLQRLKEASGKHDKVKLIVLSQPSALAPNTKPDVDITPDLIYDDVFAVVADLMTRSPSYTSQDTIQQSILVDHVVNASKGSFMWAKMVTKGLIYESSPAKLNEAAAAVKKSPKPITELTKELLTTANLSDEAKMLVCWLTIAQRPLTPDELSLLYKSDPKAGTVRDSSANVLQILQPAAQLVILHNGLLYLRHEVIQRTLAAWFVENKPTKDPALDFTMRLLTYLKSTLREQREPAFTSFDQSYVDQKFSENLLFEYAVRYWSNHYLGLSPKVREVSPELKKELANIIPVSPSIALIEKTSWTWLPTPTRILWHTSSIDLRKKVLTNRHPIVLQSLIDLATIFRVLQDYQSSANYFYQATQSSLTLYSNVHPLTVQCANSFLEVTRGFSITTRTETVTYREEILIILIESYKKQYGTSSERVKNLRTLLIELYRSVKEDQKAVKIEEETHGDLQTDTTATTGSGRSKPGIGVRLRSGRSKDLDYQEWDFDEESGRDVIIRTDWSKRIDELLQLAQTHASKGETTKAEQYYIEAWYHISQQTNSTASIETHLRKISMAITVANFYKSIKRDSEAAAMLTGVWEEYRRSSISRTERINMKLVEVAKVMNSINMTSSALEIFKHCSSVFRSLSMTESSSYKEVQEHEQTTQRELLKQASSSSGYSSDFAESIISEIFTYMENSKSSELQTTSVSAIKQIVTTAISQHKYKEATLTIKRTIRVIWPSLFSTLPEDVGQPNSNPDFALELAEQLIVCYRYRHRLMKALEIREKVYHSLKLSRKIDNELVQKSVTELFQLYEQIRAPDKITQLHRELLEDYKKVYGSNHPKVVDTLFTLARITAPEPVSAEYYRQIVTILSKDSDTCHPRAVEPLGIVAAHYWNERRYPGAIWAYSLLFRTFMKQAPLKKEGKPIIEQFGDQTFVWTIYNRYVASLRATTTDIATIYEITTQYRKTCTDIFGPTHEITIDSVLYLARVCENSKRYQAQAIYLYEELRKEPKASKYLAEITQTLEAIYEEQSLEATRSDVISASEEQVNRAVTVIRQRIVQNRSEHGWANEESLEQLKEIVRLNSRLSKKEESLKELHETIREVVTKETSSTALVRAANAVAYSFNSINETHKGLEIVEELRWQLVTKDTSNSKKYNIDVSNSSRHVAIFIAQLEYALRQDSSVSFNEIYLSIVTEIVYYEEFQRSIRSNLSIEIVFSSAVRLHSFLNLHNRTILRSNVESELVSYFIRISGQKAQIGDVAQVRVLVLTMLSYIEKHEVKNFQHSIVLASIENVRVYLRNGRQKEACDLAQTAFRYISITGGYKTQSSVKYGLILAIAIADVHGATGDLRRNQIQIAGDIIRQVLRSAQEIKLHLPGIPIYQANIFITILGEEKDYVTLEWFLTILWEARETHRVWKPAVVLELGYRLVLARFLLGKHDLALQLAADIAYNLRRVYGATHLATLEVNILLSQLCISTGLAFQSRKGAEEIARRYYKRAIGVHESVLRSLTLDPLGLTEEDDVTVLSVEPEPMDLSVVVDKGATQGTYARKHLELLKLALQRYGGYPKGEGEYEAINADAFRAYPENLRGFDSMDKWKVNEFGGGKAANNDGALDTDIKRWSLTSNAEMQQTNGTTNGQTSEKALQQ